MLRGSYALGVVEYRYVKKCNGPSLFPHLL